MFGQTSTDHTLSLEHWITEANLPEVLTILSLDNRLGMIGIIRTNESMVFDEDVLLDVCLFLDV